MYRWVIAWRWLRALPILWISVIGVLLGVGSILVVDSIFNGTLRELRRIVRGTTSDIVVSTLRRQDRSGDMHVPARLIREAILKVDGVVAAARRVRRPCLFPSEKPLPEVVAIAEVSRGTLLDVTGIVPDEEFTVSELRDFLASAPAERRVADLARPFDGSFAPTADGRPVRPIVVGEKFAAALGLSRGSRIELLTLPDRALDGQDLESLQERGIPSGVFELVGTFKTTHYFDDLTRAYVKLDDLRAFADILSETSEIAVKAAAGRDVMAIADAVAEAVRPFDLAGPPVQTWDQLEQVKLGAIENQRHVLYVPLILIVLVAGFNLLVSLNLIITEKLHDVGTLAALGGSAVGIAMVFTALGALVTAVGFVLGLVSGTVVAHRINEIHGALARWLGHTLWAEDVYGFHEIPTQIDPTFVMTAVVVTFGCTLLFSFFAALRAARLDPVVALRHE